MTILTERGAKVNEDEARGETRELASRKAVLKGIRLSAGRTEKAGMCDLTRIP